MIDRWRLDYNHHCIHSSLDYQTPAEYAAGCVLPASATPQPPEHIRITNPNALTQPGAKTGGESFFLLFPTGAEDARQLACNVCEGLLVIADGDE